MSDHSSMFDSVSGTCISLGRSSGTQKISSLAKEARDLQPGLIKDSTMTRPAVIQSSEKPLVTEAHPNPIIPEDEEMADDNSIEDGNHILTYLKLYCHPILDPEYHLLEDPLTQPPILQIKEGRITTS